MIIFLPFQNRAEIQNNYNILKWKVPNLTGISLPKTTIFISSSIYSHSKINDFSISIFFEVTKNRIIDFYFPLTQKIHFYNFILLLLLQNRYII